LPDNIRDDVVKRIADIAKNEYTSEFMNEKLVGDLMTKQETDTIFGGLKKSILSGSENIIFKIQSGWDNEGDPEDQFSELNQILSIIEESENEQEAKQAFAIKEDIDFAISKMNEEKSAAAEYVNLEAEESSAEETYAINIFEDVDE
jgi:hypothetical protein